MNTLCSPSFPNEGRNGKTFVTQVIHELQIQNHYPFIKKQKGAAKTNT